MYNTEVWINVNYIKKNRAVRSILKSFVNINSANLTFNYKLA